MAGRAWPGDGYAILDGGLPVWVRWGIHAGSLVFVDVDAEAQAWPSVLSWFRSLPDGLLGEARYLIVRYPASPDDLAAGRYPAPAEAASDLQALLAAKGFANLHVGIATFEIGKPMAVSWNDQGDPPTPADDQLLRRAREIELLALLERGHGIWEPPGHHYELPSGCHARTFVRLADAFRTPRAPAALATWLYPAIGETTLVVIDNSSVSPLTGELAIAAERAGLRLSGRLAIDRYPATLYEHRRILSEAQGLSVLALTSVTSTGLSKGHLEKVLAETVATWRSEVVISRRSSGPHPTGMPLGEAPGAQSPWLVLEDLEEPVDPTKKDCQWCRDPDVAPVVLIDPRSFAPMRLTMPEPTMPDLTDARQNRSLWEAYDTAISAGVAGEKVISFDGPIRHRRPQVEYANALITDGVYFEPAYLASSEHTGKAVDKRFAEIRKGLAQRVKGDFEVVAIERSLRAVDGFDLVVFDGDDVEALDRVGTPALHDLLASLRRSLHGSDRYCVVPSVGDDRLDDLASQLRGLTGSRVLVVALGVRTGATLQRLQIDVHDAWRRSERDGELAVKGLVLHAHPTDRRTWDGIRNSFRGQDGISAVLSLWLTFLPLRSPMVEERRVLRKGPQADDLEDRLPGRPLLSETTLQLRRTSYYGHELTDVVVLAAVGSAMHRARLAAPSGPLGVARFDLPLVMRSYFDGIIHASVLRWIGSEEAWWGVRGDDCVALFMEVLEKNQSDRPLLLCELLLAATEGKVPSAGMAFLRGEAESELASARSEPPALLSSSLALLVESMSAD